VHYTGALIATVHVICIFLSLFLFCFLCILFKFSFSDNLYILFCVIKKEKKNYACFRCSKIFIIVVLWL
jgi:hypothetical protein